MHVVDRRFEQLFRHMKAFNQTAGSGANLNIVFEANSATDEKVRRVASKMLKTIRPKRKG